MSNKINPNSFYISCEEKDCDEIINLHKHRSGRDFLAVVVHDEESAKEVFSVTHYNPSEILQFKKEGRLYFFCKKCYPIFLLEFELNGNTIDKEDLDKIVKIPHNSEI